MPSKKAQDPTLFRNDHRLIKKSNDLEQVVSVWLSELADGLLKLTQQGSSEIPRLLEWYRN